MRLWIGLLASLLLVGCASSSNEPVEPKTVDHVDLKRYQGTWYELARMPMFFQRDCAQSEARYALRTDGNISVTNRCRTQEGKWEIVTGTASPQVPGKTDKLWVEFDNWLSNALPGLAKGNYWVLYVDDGYKTALVGNPDRKYLWLLSRSTHVSEATKEELMSRAQQQGYDTTKLIWRAEDSEIAKP